MNKHETLVRQIAEEFADDRLKSLESAFKSLGIDMPERDDLIERSIPAARIAVSRMADAYRDGAIASNGGTYIDDELIGLGLIPDPSNQTK